MLDQLYFLQPIKQIQIFFYSSQNHIFINTFLIEILNQRNIAQNIRIKKTPVSQPHHHVYGQTPFISVNNIHIVKKQQIIDFMILILGIDINRKYQFLSVVNLSQQLSNVSNLFSEYDQNPYFIFISPFKKYKRHKELQDKKTWFRQNTHYYNLHEDSLNTEYFLYKINTLSSLIEKYSEPHHTRPQYLRLYKIVVFSLIKHLRVISPTLYQTAKANKTLSIIQEQVQKQINQKAKVNNVIVQQPQRPPKKNIAFANVLLNYLKGDKVFQDLKKKSQEEILQYNSQRQKFYQNIFKPAFVTSLFFLAIFAFQVEKKQV